MSALTMIRRLLPLTGVLVVSTRPTMADELLVTIDLAGQQERQVIVDREAGQYLGHPTTVLLEDGQTTLVVYPKGHGKGAIQLKRSVDL